MQKRWLTWLLLFAAATGPYTVAQSRPLQAKNDIGYVLEVEGKWYVEKKPREYLAIGQRLAAGDVVRIESPAESDHIVVSGPTGEILIKRYCDNRADCARRLVIPYPADSQPSIFDVVLQTAMRLINGKPERYSVHGVRGVTNDLQEAVCRLEGSSVDLSPVFRLLPTGRYYLKLRNLESGVSRPTLGPLRFDWNPNGGTALIVNDVVPGLYEVRLLLRSSDEYEPTMLTAWTLISSSSDFDRFTNSFRPTIALTAKWGKEISDETKRGVLRASLDNLASAR